jgi:ribosomal protein L22
MGNIQIFQLIDRKKLHTEILPHIEKLMSINKNVRLLTKILVNRSIKHAIEILPRSIETARKITVFTHNFGHRIRDSKGETADFKTSKDFNT